MATTCVRRQSLGPTKNQQVSAEGGRFSSGSPPDFGGSCLAAGIRVRRRIWLDRSPRSESKKREAVIHDSAHSVCGFPVAPQPPRYRTHALSVPLDECVACSSDRRLKEWSLGDLTHPYNDGIGWDVTAFYGALSRGWHIANAECRSPFVKKVLHRDAEGIGDLDEGADGRIPGATFEVGEVTALDGRTFGKLLLRPALLATKRLDSTSEPQ